jgi:hypothetical protein
VQHESSEEILDKKASHDKVEQFSYYLPVPAGQHSSVRANPAVQLGLQSCLPEELRQMPLQNR